MTDERIPVDALIRGDAARHEVRRRWYDVSPRNLSLLAEYIAGVDTDVIAAKYGMSHVRVTAIAKEHGAIRFRGPGRRPRRNRPSFHENVRQDGQTGCWEWTGSTTRGYGRFKGRPAHRLALEEALGRPLADDEYACHHCDNPPCVNPAHLYAGSAADNSRDVVARGRQNVRPKTFGR